MYTNMFKKQQTSAYADWTMVHCDLMGFYGKKSFIKPMMFMQI